MLRPTFNFAADGCDLLCTSGGAEIADRAAERHVAVSVFGPQKHPGGRVCHRVQKAAVDISPDIAAEVGDLGRQYAFIFININDPYPVVTDKAICFRSDML